MPPHSNVGTYIPAVSVCGRRLAAGRRRAFGFNARAVRRAMVEPLQVSVALNSGLVVFGGLEGEKDAGFRSQQLITATTGLEAEGEDDAAVSNCARCNVTASAYANGSLRDGSHVSRVGNTPMLLSHFAFPLRSNVALCSAERHLKRHRMRASPRTEQRLHDARRIRTRPEVCALIDVVTAAQSAVSAAGTVAGAALCLANTPPPPRVIEVTSAVVGNVTRLSPPEHRGDAVGLSERLQTAPAQLDGCYGVRTEERESVSVADN